MGEDSSPTAFANPSPSIPETQAQAQLTGERSEDAAAVAMRSGGGGDVKSFFRQQKPHAKPTGGVSKKAPPHHLHKAAATAAAHLQATDHGGGADAERRQQQQEEEELERAAREFDMDMRYGPCLGLTRAQRWRRAAALGLAPPPALCSDAHPCLWEGRV